MRVLGAIIAGGRASRFGSNKALALFRGEPLIAHVRRAIERQVDGVAVCGGELLLPEVLHLPDRPHAELGPLGGLASALFHAHSHGFDAVVTVGCDTPVLPPDLIDRLRARGTATYLEDMPLIGWWPSGLTRALDAFVRHDPGRSMRGWAKVAAARPISLPQSIANINTPDDLAELMP